MRRFPNSWTKTLAALGFRRVSKRRKKQAYGRHSRIESLEPRQLLAVSTAPLDPFTAAISRVTVAPSEFQAGHFTLISEDWSGKDSGTFARHNGRALGVDSGLEGNTPDAFDPHESWSFRPDRDGTLMGIEFEEFTIDDADRALLTVGNHAPMVITADSVRDGYWRPAEPLLFSAGDTIQIEALDPTSTDIRAACLASNVLGPILPSSVWKIKGINVVGQDDSVFGGFIDLARPITADSLASSEDLTVGSDSMAMAALTLLPDGVNFEMTQFGVRDGHPDEFEVTYGLNGTGTVEGPLSIDIYRSPNGTTLAGEPLFTHDVTDANDLTLTTHTISFTVLSFADVEEDYYLVAAVVGLDDDNPSNDSTEFDGGVFVTSDDVVHYQSGLASTVDTVVAQTSGGDYELLLDGDVEYSSSEAFGGVRIRTHGGNDAVTLSDLSGVDAWVFGGSGNDNVYGGDGADHLYGGDGYDTVYGNEGEDYIDGGAGASGYGTYLFGGDDGDEIYGGSGNDYISGGDGNDLLYGGDEPDGYGGYYSSGYGDSLSGGAGADVLYGGSGDDFLVGGDEGEDEEGDVLYGGSGNDTLRGGAGNDILYGESGDDALWGETGYDILLDDVGTNTLNWGQTPSAKHDPIRVTTSDDENDDLGDANFRTGSLSLREALAVAAAQPDPVIRGPGLVPDVITFDLDALAEIALDGGNGELTIASFVEIDGPGADQLSVSGAELNRVFHVTDGGDARIEGLTITKGNAPTNNEFGGGIYSEGTLTLNGVSVYDNDADSGGAGIYQGGSGDLTVLNSTIALNESTDMAGGVVVADSATALILNSTVSNNVGENTSVATGGGLYLPTSAAVTLVNTTVTGNTSDLAGAGIVNVNGSVVLHNTILAGNTAYSSTDDDLSGTLAAASSYNLLGATVTLPEGVGNASTSDPRLAPLGDYGGSTLTHALLPDSPAIDAGSNYQAMQVELTTDQRGFDWVDFPDVEPDGDNPIDIGAYEAIPPIADAGGPYSIAAADGDWVALDGSQTSDADSPLLTYEWDLNDDGIYEEDVTGASPIVSWPRLLRALDNIVPEISTTYAVRLRVSDGQYTSVTSADLTVTPYDVLLLPQLDVPDADLNGDGRLDSIEFDQSSRSLIVSLGPDTAVQTSVWAKLDISGSLDFNVGDFNGDGRDDIVARNASGEQRLALSESTLFHVFDLQTAEWADTYVGDFDSDGADELLGWNETSTKWQMLHYDARSGPQLDENWGDAVHDIPYADAIIHVGDVNRDGRDDLVVKDTTGGTYDGHWFVGLSREDTGQFYQQDLEGWFDAYDGTLDGTGDGSVVEIDGPYRVVVDAFSDVYNNVELEFYEKLMKGPTATEESRGGNDWDQAALLVEKLVSAGYVDAQIVSGDVTVPEEEVRNWLGVRTTAAALAVLEAMTGSTTDYAAGEITFNHAWVQVTAPTATGLDVINLDPSWKFKDYQEGIDLELDFNEFDYIAQAGSYFDDIRESSFFDRLSVGVQARQHPLEFYEGLVMQELVGDPIYRGSSLAEVPYDGPISQQAFFDLPAWQYANADAYHNTYGQIINGAEKNALTHRIRISVGADPGDNVLLDNEVIAQHGLGSIVIKNEDVAAGTFHLTFIVDGAASAPISLDADDENTLFIEIYRPGETSDSGYFETEMHVDETLAVALGTGQFFAERLGELAADALEFENGIKAEYRDLGDFLAYAGAKYWYDVDTSADAIAGVTHSVRISDVSGALLRAANELDPGAISGFAAESLPFTPFNIFPESISLDVFQIASGQDETVELAGGFVDIADGTVDEEAVQLFAYQYSTLEHSIIEEVTGAEAASAVKILQNAFSKVPIEDSAGHNSIMVLEYRITENNKIQLVYRGTHEYGNQFDPETATAENIWTSTADWSDPTSVPPPAWLSEMGALEAALTEFLNPNSSSWGGRRPFEENEGYNGSDGVYLAQRLAQHAMGVTDTGASHILVPQGQVKIGSGADAFVGSAYLVNHPGGRYKVTVVFDNKDIADGGAGSATISAPAQPEGSYVSQTSVNRVGTANGNVTRQETDIVFPNVGVRMDFTRTYNSQSTVYTEDKKSSHDVGLGVGWTHSFSDRLIFWGRIGSTTPDLIWLTSDGAQHRFVYHSGNYVTPPELSGKLKHVSDPDRYVFVDSDGTEYHFQEVNYGESNPENEGELRGILVKKVDNTGHGFTVTYVDSEFPPRIHEVTDYYAPVQDPFGAPPINPITEQNGKLVFAYSSASGDDPNLIDTITKWDCSSGSPVEIGTWQYDYGQILDTSVPTAALFEEDHPGDSGWRLTKVTSGTDSEYVTSGLETTYAYFGNVVGNSVTVPVQGKLQKVTEPDLQYREYEYYSNGRAFRATTSIDLKDLGTTNDDVTASSLYTFNFVQDRTQVLDALDRVETFIHQNNGLQVREIHADRTRIDSEWGEITDPSGVGQAEYALDDYLLLSRTDEVGAVQTFKYWINENLNYEDNFVNSFRFRQLTESKSAHFVDSNDDIIDEAKVIVTSYEYKDPAELASYKSHLVLPSTVTIQADVPNGDELTTTYSYDTLGNLTEVEDALGNRTLYEYYGQSDVAANAEHEGEYYLVGQMKSQWDPNAVWEHGPVDWRVLVDEVNEVDEFEVTPEEGEAFGTLKVVLSSPTGDTIVADAIRIDRIEDEGIFTRVIDNNYAEDDFGKFVASGTGGTAAAPSGQAAYYDSVLVLTGGETATWTFKNLVPGHYRVSATWTSDGDNDDAAEFVVTDVATDTSSSAIPVDQTEAPGDSGDHFGDYESTFDYDAAGNLIATEYEGVLQQSGEFDHNGNPVSATDRTGVTTYYQSDILGRLRKSWMEEDGTTLLTTHDYDAAGRRTLTTDPLGRRTYFQYDGRNLVTTMTGADQVAVTYEYDDVGNMVAYTDQRGRVTRMVYDSRNRLVQKVYADGKSDHVRYDGTGRVAEVIDALGRSTKYTYDAEGRQLTTVNANPDLSRNTAINTYDNLGRLVAKVDYEGNTTTYEYDDLGRVVQTRVESNTTGSPVSLSTTEYDANGNVVRRIVYDAERLLATDGLNLSSLPDDAEDLIELLTTYAEDISPYVHEFKTVYDTFDRSTGTIYVGGAVDGGDVTTHTFYDGAGRVRFTYDELGHKTEMLYDDFGRLEHTILPDPDGDLEEYDSPETWRTYDKAGNVLTTEDANGHVTTDEYDVFNRLVAVTDAEGNTTRSVYDVAGQMVAAVDALGRAAYTLYDKRGRVSLNAMPDPDGAEPLSAPVTRYKYDDIGNQIEVTGPNGYVTEFEYDELNRLTREITSDALINDEPEASQGNGVPISDVESSFGLDHLTVTNSAGAATAKWTIDDLRAGSYSVSMTWDGLETLTGTLTTQIVVYDADDSQVSTTPGNSITQSHDPTDFVFDYQGQWRGWRRLHDGIDVPEGGRIEVTLTDANGTEVRADAVMVERQQITTGMQIFDIDDPTSDPYFSMDEGSDTTTTDADGSFGRDHTDVTGDGRCPPTVTWTFDDLVDEATYRVAIAWHEDGSLDPNASATVEVFESGGQTAITTLTVPVDQITTPPDFALDDQGTAIGWQSLGQVHVPTGGVIKITLTGSDDDTTIRADAVMLDQVAERSFQYDGNGNVISQTDALGRTSTSAYDKLNRLTSTTLPDPDGASDLVAPVTELTYDGFGNVVMVTEYRGTADDRITVREYDKRNRLTLETLASGTTGAVSTKTEYDDAGNVRRTFAAFNSADEVVTEYQYDDLNRLWIETDDTGRSEGGSPNTTRTPVRHQTEYKYDDVGNIKTSTTTITDPQSPFNSASTVTIYEYDDVNRLTKQVDDAGGETYNVNATTTFVYDAVGNVIAQTVWLDEETGLTSTTEYDRLNRATSTVSPDPDGPYQPLAAPKVDYVYDVLGNVARATNREEETTQSIFDPLGREINRFDGEGYETRYRYDVAGKMTRLIDAEQNVTDFEYDNLDRLITSTIYDDASQPLIRQYFYNDAGNVDYAVDRNGRATKFAYDALDRTTAEEWYTDTDDIGTLSLRLGLLSWAYDDLGRVTMSSSRSEGEFPSLEYEETFAYDNLGRVTQHDNFDVGGVNPQVREAYQYDLIDTGDAPFQSVYRQYIDEMTTEDAIITYSADRLGRTVEIDDAAVGDIAGKTVTFTYDAAGRMLTTERDAADFDFDTVYTYDYASRLTTLSHFRGGETEPFVGYTYSYDAASRITRIDTECDITNAATFAAFGSDPTRSEVFDFDDVGQLTDRAADGGSDTDDSFEYDANGNRQSADGDAYTTIANNRLDSDGTYKYTYDNEGNLTQRTELAEGQPTGGTTVYTWDHRNRLVTVQEKPAPDGDVTKETHYTYNNDDLRVSKTVLVDGGTSLTETDVEYYVYDATQVVLVLDGDASGTAAPTSGDLQNRYLYALGIDELLTDENFGGWGTGTGDYELLWAATDHLGSVRQLLDESETVVEHREYDSFGNIVGLFDADGNEEADLTALDSAFAFAGREWDNDLGLYYNRARWLDPQIGRFLSEDPLGFEGGETNPYRYAGNNPFMLTDSTGMSFLGDLFHDVGDFFSDTFKKVGNFVDNYVDNVAEGFKRFIRDPLGSFEYIVTHPDDAVKGMVTDPLFWVEMVTGIFNIPTFTANVTWGSVSTGVGISGFQTPSLIGLGREAYSFVFGEGIHLGTPKLNFTALGYSRSFDLGSWLGGGLSGGYSPALFAAPEAAPVAAGQAIGDPSESVGESLSADTTLQASDQKIRLVAITGGRLIPSSIEDLNYAYDMARISERAYNPLDTTPIGDWLHSGTGGVFTDPSGGKAVLFFDRRTGQKVLAFAGTELEVEDWKTDFEQWAGKETAQYTWAVGLAGTLKDKYGNQLSLAGHSLGGGLSTAAAAANKLRATVFNPAALHPDNLARYGGSTATIREFVTAYHVQSEALTTAEGVFGASHYNYGVTYSLPAKPNTSGFNLHRMPSVLWGIQDLRGALRRGESAASRLKLGIYHENSQNRLFNAYLQEEGL